MSDGCECSLLDGGGGVRGGCGGNCSTRRMVVACYCHDKRAPRSTCWKARLEKAAILMTLGWSFMSGVG